jgi:hypothetical protein
MTKAFLLLALFGLFSTSSCKKNDEEIRPTNYDILAMETGHWEWDKTLYFGPSYTPATEGYTRQLVFRADRQLLLRRSNQSDKTTSYQLSVNPSGMPTVTYNIDEGNLTNNDNKYYRISQENGEQILQLTGEEASRDAGGYETYHWVAE